MGLYENVLGLKTPPKMPSGEKGAIEDSNLAVCFHQLRVALGQVAFAFELDPRCFAHPHSRPRIYMPSFEMAWLQELGLGVETLYKHLATTITKISNGWGLVPMEKFLLDVDHPIVEVAMLAASEKSHDDDEDGEAEEVAWAQKHHDMAKKTGDDWTRHFVVTEEDRDLFPAVNQLTWRNRDVLATKGITLKTKGLRVVELSQTFGRGFDKTKCIGCLTPSFKAWLTDYNRFILGAEALSMQGISYSEDAGGHSALVDYTDSFLLDLAGNAFHAGCCCGMLLSMFVSVGYGYLPVEVGRANKHSEPLYGGAHPHARGS